jgi:two-component system phosphate regulon sensor histidine kinase PhoR
MPCNSKKIDLEKKVFLLTAKQREKLLKDAVDIINEEETIENIKIKIVTLVGKVFQADRCFIRIFNETADDFEIVDNHSEYLSSPKIKSLVGLEFEALFNRFVIDQYKAGTCFYIPDVKTFCEQHSEYPFLRLLRDSFMVKSNYFCPISKNSKLYGAFIVHYVNNIAEIGQEEKDILKSIAKQVINAIQKNQFQNQIMHQNKRSVLMHTIIEKIRKSLDLKKIKKLMVTETCKALNADRCFLVAFDPQTNKPMVLDEHSEYLSSPDLKSCVGFDFSDSEVARLAAKHQKKESIIVHDIESLIKENNLQGTSDAEWLLKLQIKSGIAMVIFYGEQIYGVLCVHYTKKVTPITDDLIQFVRALADQAGIALYQANLYEKEKKAAEREALMRNIISVINSSLDINQIKKNLVDSIGKVLNLSRCLISEYDAKINFLIPIDKYSEYRSSENVKSVIDYVHTHEDFKFLIELGLNKIELFETDVENFVENNKDKISNMVEKYLKDYDIKASFQMPITYGDKLVGVIAGHYPNTREEFLEEEKEFLRILSRQAGIGIYQARLYENERTALKHERILSELINKTQTIVNLNESLFVISDIVEKHYNTTMFFITGFNHKQNTSNMYRECSSVKNDCCYNFKKSEIIKDYLYALSKGPLDQIIFNNIDDLNIPQKIQKEFEDLNINSFMFVMKKINNNEKIGIMLFHEKEGTWKHSDISFVSRIVDQVDHLIKNSRLYNQMHFNANVSHELKTPIAIIKGYAEVLLKRKKYDKNILSDFLNIIIKNVDRVDEIINNLIYLTNLDNYRERKDINLKNVAIFSLINTAIENCQKYSTEKNIQIFNEADENIKVSINQPLMIQALMNLITNAVKYSESDTIVKINTATKKHEVCICVVDEGCGISLDEANKIFEPFYRVDNSRSRKTGGSGLGLSITKFICETHGGSISVSSQKQKGSTFTIHLPT